MAHQTNLYRGYSSFNFQSDKTFALRDVELVQTELLAHIFTTKGSRVMMPNFGSNIPTMAFEPLDEMIVDEVYTELLNIFDYDPRVEVVSLRVIPDFDNNSIEARARLRYIELDTVDDFDLNIDFEN